MNLKRTIFLICLITGIFNASLIKAQSVKPQNFSNVRIDELTDEQLRRFITQADASGLTESQLEQRALSLGMKPVEVQKLKERVKKFQKEQKNIGLKKSSITQGNSYPVDSLVSETDSLSLTDRALAELKSKIFGVDLFVESNTSFEPNIRIATPLNYQLGPDDELLIDIYGFSEASYNLVVNPEGTINVPFVGIIPVSGLSIEEATLRISTRLTAIYPELKTGNTKFMVSLGNIRSIRVVLTGELVKPGTYTLPSVGTIFNALYQSGGPTENGSFREIELIRGGVKIATLDVYDFLLRGEFKNNIQLQDQDVIRVPTYNKRVEIVGEVKRPGIFEMVSGENLNDLLHFAGDFTERAYQARIKVLKNTTTERKISDVTTENFTSYEPSGGDKFFVNEILDRFQNLVSIEGSVFRPGQYELDSGLTITQLLKKAEGLTEDAFLDRAYITRLGDDLQLQLIPVDVGAILTGKSTDIILQREDVFTIASIFDLKEEYYVKIDGEVRYPGKFNFAEGLTVEDLILKAGGFKEGSSSKQIEVSRRVKNTNSTSNSAQIAEVYQVNVDLNLANEAFVLQPFDIVNIRSSAGYEVQKQVKIQGEVIYPGIYTIKSKDERISDLIRRAGGFTEQAYIEGASLLRSPLVNDSLKIKNEFSNNSVNSREEVNEEIEIEEITINSSSNKRIVTPNSNNYKNDFVGINLSNILLNPGTKQDLFLEANDVLNIPKELQTVKISGEVLSPVTVIFSKNKGLKSYVSNAGGFTEKSNLKKSYVKYANGSMKSVKKVFIFKKYPQVLPGSEIIIPEGSVRTPLKVSEIIGVTSSLLTIFVLLNSLNLTN